MDYEKKYKEALLKARDARQNTESAVTIGILEEIFPELAVSEDEKIRILLISLVENWKIYNPNSPFADYPIYESNKEKCDKILAWLEKQKLSEEEKRKAKAYDTVHKSIAFIIDKFKERNLEDSWVYKNLSDAFPEIVKEVTEEFKKKLLQATQGVNSLGDVDTNKALKVNMDKKEQEKTISTARLTCENKSKLNEKDKEYFEQIIDAITWYFSRKDSELDFRDVIKWFNVHLNIN